MNPVAFCDRIFFDDFSKKKFKVIHKKSLNNTTNSQF